MTLDAPVTRRTLLITAGGAIGSLLLASCAPAGGAANSPGTSGAPQGEPPQGEPVQGGTLKVAWADDPENVDPHQKPQLVARTVSRQIADTLTAQDPETGDILPWIAEEWQISDDVKTFTFTLREGVTFSDGTPLDAAAVAANFDRIIEIGPLAYIAAGMLRTYKASTVVDARTVRVEFEEPNAQFLQATSLQSLSILAPATLKLDPTEVAAGKVIGSGPFVLESYTPGEQIVLTAREDYAWPSPTYTNQGRAYLDRIEISFVPEPTTLAGSVTSGQIDFAYILDPAVLATVEQSQAKLIETAMPAIAIPIVPLVYRPIFADERVRRALSLATDRQAAVDSIFGGRYKPASSVLTTTNPGYVDLSELTQFDPDAAIKLLEEAGFTELGADGIRTNAEGDPLRFEIQYASTGGSAEQLLQLLQQQWLAVGIDFVLTPVSTASEADLDQLPFDITTWSQTRPDPDVLRTVYSSFFQNQSFLYNNADEELDGLLESLQTTVDSAERLKVSEQAQRLILERGYSVPLYDLTQFSAAAAGIGGAHADIEGKPIFTDAWKQA